MHRVPAAVDCTPCAALFGTATAGRAAGRTGARAGAPRATAPPRQRRATSFLGGSAPSRSAGRHGTGKPHIDERPRGDNGRRPLRTAGLATAEQVAGLLLLRARPSRRTPGAGAAVYHDRQAPQVRALRRRERHRRASTPSCSGAAAHRLNRRARWSATRISWRVPRFRRHIDRAPRRLWYPHWYPGALSRTACNRGLTAFAGPSRGVSDGTRTRDHLDHNQELYQLSYAHRAARSVAATDSGGSTIA